MTFDRLPQQMNTKSKSAKSAPVFSQREILGYGSELANALSRYQNAGADQSQRESILRSFATWLSNCASIRDHLCFADIYYRPDPWAPASEAISYLVTPVDRRDLLGGHARYVDALNELWGPKRQYAFAPHRLFSRGLPIFGDNGDIFPETEADLRACEASMKSGTRRDSGFFLAQIEPAHAQGDGSARAEFRATSATANGLVASELGPVFEKVFSSDLDASVSNTSILSLWERWVNVFKPRTESFRSQTQAPLEWLLTMPVGYQSDTESHFTCFATLFIGFDATLERPDVLEAMRYILLNLVESHATAVAKRVAQGWQRGQFAHQTSAVIDSILQDVKLLPDAVQEHLGGYLLARMHLLRATINSYRTHGSRVDLGVFPYPWKNGDRALDIYRDVGIQLGLARAQDADQNEKAVRDEGALLNEDNYQVGEAGFAKLRDKYFAPLPDTAAAEEELRHSSFAVLILLTIKQAVYHTIRAQCKTGECSSRVKLDVREADGEVRFRCTVRNPEVPGTKVGSIAKDAEELAALARKLTGVGKYSYSVEGPTPDPNSRSWFTTVAIRQQAN